jgi:hypothetical protein
MGEDSKSLEEAYESLAATLRVKQEFQRILIDGIGTLPGERLGAFAERIVREVQSWRSGARWKSLPSVDSVPDVTATAGALARESWDDERDHGELMRSAAGKLAALQAAAGILLAERNMLRWLHAEAVDERGRLHTWQGLMSLLDEHYPSEVFDGSSGDDGPRIVSLVREIERLRREVEFEAKAEPWGPSTIVAPVGHGYINGGNCCECGLPTQTLRTYQRHVHSLLRACACVTDEQANQLAHAGFSRPVCAVHPEGGDPA